MEEINTSASANAQTGPEILGFPDTTHIKQIDITHPTTGQNAPILYHVLSNKTCL